MPDQVPQPLAENSDLVTEPGFEFVTQTLRLFLFLHESTFAQDTLESILRLLACAREDGDPSDLFKPGGLFERLPNLDFLVKHADISKQRTLHLYGDAMARAILRESVDGFSTYLIDLLALVACSDGGAIRIGNSQHKKAARILAAVTAGGRRDSLAYDLTELLYSSSTGYPAHADLWRDLVGIDLDILVRENGKDFLWRATGLRNIYVHNNGILNSRNSKYLPEHTVGERVQISLETVLKMLPSFLSLAIFLEENMPKDIQLRKTRSLTEDHLISENLSKLRSKMNSEPED